MNRSASFLFVFAAAISLVFASVLYSQSTSFVYQGTLDDNGTPANGNHDFEFRLFDQALNGSQAGPVLSANAVEVAAGAFTVNLDFGAQFPGADRWLEISVRQSAAPASAEALGGFTILTPRQQISSSPYAIKSLNATSAVTADNALGLGGVAAGQYVLTTDPRMMDSRTPVPGSADYIQNGNTEQPSSNFRISGKGSADILNAGTHFEIGGLRVFAATVTDSTFAGFGAGDSVSSGVENTFVGAFAGATLTTSSRNSFFGSRAGTSISSFSGKSLGNPAQDNSFFGANSGKLTNNSYYNSFFGSDSGSNNTNGVENSFFGFRSGYMNVGGDYNSFFGKSSGAGNISGNRNTYSGYNTGLANVTGSNLTLIGADANVGIDGLSFATAIGAGAAVSTSNTIVLGRSSGNDTVNVPGNLLISGILSAGLPTGSANYIQNTNSPQASASFNIDGVGIAQVFDSAAEFRIGGARVFSTPLDSNTYVGFGAGPPIPALGFNLIESIKNTAVGYNTGSSIGATGHSNSFFGANAGASSANGTQNSFFGVRSGELTTSHGNSFFGVNSGAYNTLGFQNSFFGLHSGFLNTVGTSNSFFGNGSGSANSNGSDNAFFGAGTGAANTIGIKNTLIGWNVDLGANNLTNSTAVGAQALVAQSNSLVLGSINGVNGATADTKVGIGTTAPTNAFTVLGVGEDTGGVAGVNEVVARFKQMSNTNHVGVSIDAFSGTDPILYLSEDGSAKWDIRNDAGNDALQIRYQVGAANSTRFSINTSGHVAISQLGVAGTTSLCHNASNQISTCSSSIRYKKNIEDFTAGIDLIMRLRPVSFNWKDGGMLDMGLVAEEVAEIEPLLATYNKDGKVEGVKYDRVGVVLVNVVKEQQAEIESLREEMRIENGKLRKQSEKVTVQEERIKKLEDELSGLKALICASNRDATICQ